MSSLASGVSARSRAPIFLGLCVLALSILYPLVFLATSALRTKNDYDLSPFGLPRAWTFDNFRNLWNNYGIGAATLHSITVVVTALAITLSVSSLAGYAIAKLPVPGVKLVNAAFVSVMLIPGQVLIIPIYLMLSKVDLVGSYWGVIAVYVATNIPFAVFFLGLSFRAIPDEVLEAAKIDGAGFVRTFRSMIVPLGASSLATLAVLQFLAMWNELLYAYILLPDESKLMLTPALSRIGGRYLSDQPLVSAGLVVTSAFPILLLMAASRHVMTGLAAGVSK